MATSTWRHRGADAPRAAREGGLTSPGILVRPLLRPPPGLERLRTRLAILGFWVLMGSLESVKEMAAGALQGTPRTLEQVLIVNFPWWFFWVAGTLIVLGLARRFPVDRPSRGRSVAVHVLAAALTAIVHLTLVGAFLYYTMARGAPVAEATLWAQIRYWLGAYLVIDMFVYWMVLGAYYGFLYHRRYLQGRLREAEASRRAATLEAQAAEAKLRALRMELNPHFLFNALNSVTALIEDERDRDATAMLAQLSRLLRATLSRGRKREVELEQELEYIERYLDIERVRFGDWLTTEVVVEPGIRDALVPPMILQPLVENAVRHGASPSRGQASIRITGASEDGRVRLTVRDDGPGPPDRLREGTGLRNLRERLATAYDGAATLSLRRGQPSGCVAEVVLPFRRATPPGAEEAGQDPVAVAGAHG